MTKAKLTDLEEGLNYVSGAPYGERSATICPRTGKIHLHSEFDDFAEHAEEVPEPEDQVEIPHKNDLRLGRELVLYFVAEHLPDDLAAVEAYFRKRGAYAKYKTLLEGRDVLDEWYEFENARVKAALRNWCRASDIELLDE